ncbi:MAG TPA: hypothetical protein VF062_17550 [Candidatus Limnocylindrales bacterium]
MTTIGDAPVLDSGAVPPATASRVAHHYRRLLLACHDRVSGEPSGLDGTDGKDGRSDVAAALRKARAHLDSVIAAFDSQASALLLTPAGPGILYALRSAGDRAVAAAGAAERRLSLELTEIRGRYR